jgi:hypothetical protein
MAAILVSATAAISTGCGGDSPKNSSGSGEGGAGGSSNYGTSECGVCVKDACSTAIDACNADPECPGFLACLFDCPVGDDGNADLDCAAACPTGSTSESKKASAEVGACRIFGDGKACKGCGIPEHPDYTTPELNQKCGPPDSDDPCVACNQQHCCELRDACQSDGTCDEFIDCFVACFDGGGTNAACDTECGKQLGDEKLGKWAAFFACSNVFCAPELESNSCDVTERDACSRCFYETCGDPYFGLIGTASGYALDAVPMRPKYGSRRVPRRVPARRHRMRQGLLRRILGRARRVRGLRRVRDHGLRGQVLTRRPR